MKTGSLVGDAAEGARRARQATSEEQNTELTWAAGLREEGREEAKRETLKRQLSAKFGHLPSGAEAHIDAIHSAEELERYLDRVLTAKSLEELGSAAEPRSRSATIPSAGVAALHDLR